MQDRVAIVTGASSGIGEATARALATRGAHLVLAARSEERLERLARELERAGARVLVQPTDVRDLEACQRLLDRTLEVFGRLDLLINNAGVGDWSLLEREDPGRIENMVRTNMLGLLYMSRLAVPVMLRQGEGVIVQVASLAGLMGLPFQAVYGATKAAVIALSRSLRSELQGRGVHVLLVMPGPVRTAFFRNANMRGFERLPLPVAEPEEVARRILDGCARRRSVVFVDGFGRLVYYASRLAPGLVDRIARSLYFRAQRHGQAMRAQKEKA